MISWPGFAKCEMDEFYRVSDCPEDVKLFLERIGTCYHFRGEHTGNARPERDKEVNKAFEQFHCDDKYKREEFLTIIRKYKTRYDGVYDGGFG